MTLSERCEFGEKVSNPFARYQRPVFPSYSIWFRRFLLSQNLFR